MEKPNNLYVLTMDMNSGEGIARREWGILWGVRHKGKIGTTLTAQPIKYIF